MHQTIIEEDGENFFYVQSLTVNFHMQGACSDLSSTYSPIVLIPLALLSLILILIWIPVVI